MSTSTSSGCWAVCWNWRLPGRIPKSACKVRAWPMRSARACKWISSPKLACRLARDWSMDWRKRAAALPVGAAKATRNCAGSALVASSSASKRAAV